MILLYDRLISTKVTNVTVLSILGVHFVKFYWIVGRKFGKTERRNEMQQRTQRSRPQMYWIYKLEANRFYLS